MQIHECSDVISSSVFELLGRVDKRPGEPHAVVYVIRTASPTPTLWRRLTHVAIVARAIREVASAAWWRHSVHHTRTGDGMNEGCLSSACMGGIEGLTVVVGVHYDINISLKLYYFSKVNKLMRS